MALRRIATISALTLSVLLTACGGGSSGSTTTSSTTSSAAPSYAATTDTVSTFATVPASMGYGVAVDSQGNVYAESGTSILKYPASGGTPTTFATVSNATSLNDMKVDSQGNLYVITFLLVNNVPSYSISKYSQSGVLTTIDSTTTGLNEGISSIALDSQNNLYVAGITNSGVTKIIKFASGSTTNPTNVNITLPSGITAFNVIGMTFDSSGNLFITDTINNNIEKIDSSGNLTVFAGNSSHIPGYQDATGTAAQFNSPRGITVDSANNLYVVDSANHVIRKITSSAVVTTIAGVQTSTGNNNGAGNIATFGSSLQRIAIDSSGNLYVADIVNSEIRKIVP